jgi:hypothetical protein
VVSDLNKKIYGTIEAWRNRPIEGEHLYARRHRALAQLPGTAREIGGVTSVRGAVCRAACRVDGIGPIKLDLLVIQIDGQHIGDDRCSSPHSVGLLQGATENAAACRHSSTI